MKPTRAEKQWVARQEAHERGPSEGTRAERRRTSRERQYAKVPKVSGGLGISLELQYRRDQRERTGAGMLGVFLGRDSGTPAEAPGCLASTGRTAPAPCTTPTPGRSRCRTGASTVPLPARPIGASGLRPLEIWHLWGRRRRWSHCTWSRGLHRSHMSSCGGGQSAAYCGYRRCWLGCLGLEPGGEALREPGRGACGRVRRVHAAPRRRSGSTTCDTYLRGRVMREVRRKLRD